MKTQLEYHVSVIIQDDISILWTYIIRFFQEIVIITICVKSIHGHVVHVHVILAFHLLLYVRNRVHRVLMI